MRARFVIILRAAFLLMLVAASLVVTTAQAPDRGITVTVRETGGIRRSTFPVSARVPLPQGALREPVNVRLKLNNAAVPVQATVETKWPDGSVRELVLDFSSSPGPNETLSYVVQYAGDLGAEPAARGLTLTEDAEGVQIGNVKFGKTGAPLLRSVMYREQAIGGGMNGLVVTDSAGAVHDLSTAQDLKFEIVKRGPLMATLRYTGTVPLGASGRAPFVVIAEMPSSKSWVKLSAHVDDPGRLVKEVAFSTPLTLGEFPKVWDFGTARWTYGSMRNATDSVVMTSTATPRSQWTVASGPKGRELPYEVSPANTPPFAGWGHIQGAKEVVAFVVEHAPEWTGTTRIALDGGGTSIFSLVPDRPATRHDIVLYEHFVSTPVQVGAATSPSAIISPLVVAVAR